MKEGQLKDIEAKVQKQAEQIALLTDQQKTLQDHKTENQTKLTSAVDAKRIADNQHQTGSTTEKTTVDTLSEKQKVKETKNVELQQAVNQLESKNAELINKERAALETKNKLTAIDDDLKMVDMNVAQLQQQTHQEQVLLNDEKRKLERYDETKRKLETDIRTNEVEKRRIEEQFKNFERELRTKNQAMQAKNAQIMNIEAEVKEAREATNNNEINHRQQNNELERVQEQITQNARRLHANDRTIRTLTEQMRREEATLEVS
jgi:chromosome segregation ATPase